MPNVGFSFKISSRSKSKILSSLRFYSFSKDPTPGKIIALDAFKSLKEDETLN